MGLAPLEIDDEPDTAGVMLKLRIVKTLSFWGSVWFGHFKHSGQPGTGISRGTLQIEKKRPSTLLVDGLKSALVIFQGAIIDVVS